MLRRIVANVGRLQKSKSLSTDARVIKSQFPDVNIPNLRVDEYIFKNIARWADKTALVSITLSKLQHLLTDILGMLGNWAFVHVPPTTEAKLRSSKFSPGTFASRKRRHDCCCAQ